MTETTVHLAIWLERRLDMSLGFHLPLSRLYGIVVNDPLGLLDDAGQAARTSFIEDSDDVYDMIGGSAGVLARSFDAAAIITCGWAAPIDDELMCVPSRHPQRRRVRVVTVIDDGGCASVIRFADEPDRMIAQPTQVEGDIVAALQAMWRGGRAEFVNSRTTVRPRHRRL